MDSHVYVHPTGNLGRPKNVRKVQEVPFSECNVLRDLILLGHT